MSGKKDRFVNVRFSEEELAIAYAVSDQEGKSISAMARLAIMRDFRRRMRSRGTIEPITAKAKDFADRRNKATEERLANMQRTAPGDV